MKTGFLITARLKSSRLPLKLLLKLKGREVVRHVIDRAKAVAGIDQVVLCTSTNPQDATLAQIALEEGIPYYLGDEVDVLKRLRDAAEYFQIDHFLSMTADNPLFCVYHSNRLADLLRDEQGLDFAYVDGLPLGTSVYVLRTRAVDVVCRIKEAVDTEIWGPFINRPDFFNVNVLKATNAWAGDARLTLDEPEDYQFLCSLLNYCDGEVSSLQLPRILQTIYEKPDLATVNSGIVQRQLDPSIQKAIDRVYLEHERSIREMIAASH